MNHCCNPCPKESLAVVYRILLPLRQVRFGDVENRDALFGEAAKQPLSCHCQLLSPVSDWKCSSFVPCQKQQSSLIQAELRAQAF